MILLGPHLTHLYEAVISKTVLGEGTSKTSFHQFGVARGVHTLEIISSICMPVGMRVIRMAFFLSNYISQISSDTEHNKFVVLE